MPFEPDPVDPNRRAAVIDRLRTEVPRRRARRRAAASVVVATTAVLLLAFVVLPAVGDGDRETLDLAGSVTSGADGETTETTRLGSSTETVPPTTPITTVPETPPPTVAATEPAASGTTFFPDTWNDTCYGGYDPACGPLVYDPAPPPNQPITISVQATPAGPYHEGDEVHLVFTIDDPDAPIDGRCVHQEAHYTPTTMYVSTGCNYTPPCSISPDRYGTWPPPTPTPGHVEIAYDVTMTHETESSLLVQVTVQSGAPCPNPEAEVYGSTADDTFQFSWS